MSNEKNGIIEHQVKNEQGEIIDCRKYYTPKGLAARLPGRKHDGSMNVCTVYGLMRQGMPGVATIAGKKLLPIDCLQLVMDWLEKKNQRI